jgi:hypothetical protein
VSATQIQEPSTNSLLNEIPISLDSFLERVGITDTTAWRWRKKDWLKTRNISGRLYIMPADLREFNRRMKAGEFAKEHKAPKKKKAEPVGESSLTE